MSLFSAFDTKDLEAFAVSLAEDLGRRFPPASEARTDPGAKHQVKVILEGLSARAVRYREQNKLGIYKNTGLLSTGESPNVFRIESDKTDSGE